MTSNDFNPDGDSRRRPVTARELRKAKEARERQEMGWTENTEAEEREPEEKVTEKDVPNPEKPVLEEGGSRNSPFLKRHQTLLLRLLFRCRGVKWIEERAGTSQRGNESLEERSGRKLRASPQSTGRHGKLSTPYPRDQEKLAEICRFSLGGISPSRDRQSGAGVGCRG